MPDRTAEHLSQDRGVRTAPLRAIGVGNNVFATECFLDEIAARRGVDPVELRLQLLREVPRARRVIEEALVMSEYRRPRPGRGLGFAYLNYSGTETAGVVEIFVDRARGDIQLHNFWATIDCGIAVQPDNVAGAERKLARVRHRPRDERAHHAQGRCRSAVEFLRLQGAAHARQRHRCT